MLGWMSVAAATFVSCNLSRAAPDEMMWLLEDGSRYELCGTEMCRLLADTRISWFGYYGHEERCAETAVHDR